MPLKIFKYELSFGNGEHLELPANAVPLSIGMQNGKIVMWVKLDPAASTVTRNFQIIETGQAMPDKLAELGVFVGTVQSLSGLVWHIFELPS